MKYVQKQILDSFMSRVNKLSVGRTTKDKYYGTVRLVTPAICCARKFSVSGSRMIPNGAYTIGGLRKKLSEAIA